ncbi:MAG: lysophospholipid acyltransferase family protein [Micropepsaceae bacterium]
MTENPPAKLSPQGPRIPFARRLRYFAEAAGFFAIIGGFRLFNIDRASAIGGWIGRKLIAPTRFSNLARENLHAAFPEKSNAEVEKIIRGMWDNLGRVMAEYAHLDKISYKGQDPRISISGLENAPPLERRKNGVLLISAHFANWEIMPTAAREFGLSGATIVRPTNNPFVNAWLEKLRTRNGMPELVSKGGDALRRIYGILRDGNCICMLVDQRASEGVLVPFFERDAFTTPAPGALAMRLNAIIVPFSNERVDGSRFHVRLHPVIEAPNTGDAQRDLLEFAAKINAFIEERVREHPEQWLWIHRRWVAADAPLKKRAQALEGAFKATSKRF